MNNKEISEALDDVSLTVTITAERCDFIAARLLEKAMQSKDDVEVENLKAWIKELNTWGSTLKFMGTWIDTSIDNDPRFRIE